MRCTLHCALVFTCLLTWLPSHTRAQTTGVPGVNDMSINGQGSGATSCTSAADALLAPGGAVVHWNVSGPASAPLVVATATSCFPGLILVDPGPPAYTVDLDPLSISFALDGTGAILPPGFITPFVATGPGGEWDFSITVNRPSGPWVAFQTGIVSPAFPTSIGLTQTIEATMFGDPCANATAGNEIPAGDDSVHVFPVDLGGPATFPFYDSAYSNVWINSNGNLTFCTGDTDFSPSAGEFTGAGNVSAEPRIAIAWHDWAPNQGGSVHVINTAATLEAIWCDVRRINCAVPDSNSFSVLLDKASGDVTMHWGLMGFCNGATSAQCIVGISRGFDPAGLCSPILPAPVLAASTDLDLLPVAAQPLAPVWEHFFAPSPPVNATWDLEGKTFTFSDTLPGTGAYGVF